MVKCPKCKGEYYTIVYVKTYDENDDDIIRVSEVECDNCHARFVVKEFFTFVRDENYSDYYME